MVIACLIATLNISAVNMDKNSKIYQTILRSKEANASNGVFDPNQIYPGQTLTFLFADGYDTTMYTNQGDNQWKMVGNVIDRLENEHGQNINYDPNIKVPTYPPASAPKVRPTTKSEPQNFIGALGSAFGEIPWWVWVLAAIIVLFVMFRDQFKNPATSGEPMRAGGITNENRNDVAREIAQRQFPGQTIRVFSTQVGFLTAINAIVNYRGESTTQRRTFLNEPGIEAMILVGDSIIPQRVYGLMRCANDVISGSFFTGNITFKAQETQPVNATPSVEVVEKDEVVPVKTKPSMDAFIEMLPEIIKSVNEKDQNTEIMFTGIDGSSLTFKTILPQVTKSEENVKKQTEKTAAQ